MSIQLMSKNVALKRIHASQEEILHNLTQVFGCWDIYREYHSYLIKAYVFSK